MKIYKYLATALLLVSAGCSKDFLTTTPEGGEVGSSKIEKYNKENPSVGANIQDALAKGLYSWMYTQEAGGLNGNHSDFGQKSIDLCLDVLSGDFVKYKIDDYGWFGDLQQYQVTASKTANYNYMPWRYFYRMVFTANGIIDGLGGDEANPESAEARHSLGQALGVRGYAYFYLTQCFSSEYKPNDALVPIYRSLKEIDNPVSTQKEVYDRTIADLSRAAELLKDFSKTSAYEISADVAKVYLAYTYAAMGEYDKVKSLTEEIMGSGKYLPFSLNDILYPQPLKFYKDKSGNQHLGDPVESCGMGDASLPGVMWGVDITEDMGLNLVSYWGQIDLFSYSYTAAGEPFVCNEKLYASIPEGDRRKAQYFMLGEGKILPLNKFYHKDRTIMKQYILEADYVYMRYDEVILLNAEANAFLGNDAEARKVLKDYLSYAPDGAKSRVADTSYLDALSGQSLKDEIYHQIRIEFLGEGRSLFALRRFKKTAEFGTNRADLQWQGKSMRYDDPRMSFKIPENEEVNNPNLYKSKK